MRLFFTALITALFLSAPLKAQEGIPVYFDYLSDNYYLIYPSMAGIGQGGKLRLTIRQQWFGLAEAPNLQTFNGHFRVGANSGIGAIFFNDANGYHSQTGVKFTYAHHLNMGADFRSLNQLSFGLSAGAIMSNLDETEFVSIFADPTISGTRQSASYFNVDVGMSYTFFEFYAHAAVLNVMGSGRDLYSAQDFENLRRYLFSVGYVFGRKKMKVEPSVLFQMTDLTQEKTIDINGKVYYDVDFGQVWGGLSYRSSFDGAQFQVGGGNFQNQRLQLFTPIVGVNYKNFMFSYNYSYQSGDIRLDNGGFHQITLGLNLGDAGQDRYDCYCPAANY